jgi:hypothetical protein
VAAACPPWRHGKRSRSAARGTFKSASCGATATAYVISSAADRVAFAEELAGAVTALVSKYHDESAEHGRDHRIVVAVHPSVG